MGYVNSHFLSQVILFRDVIFIIIVLDNVIELWCNTDGFSRLRRKVPQHVVEKLNS